ncbi:hypothetical protein Q5752_000345 [Cryptotrichosporon argae]
MPTESAPPPALQADAIKCSLCGAAHAAEVCQTCARDPPADASPLQLADLDIDLDIDAVPHHAHADAFHRLPPHENASDVDARGPAPIPVARFFRDAANDNDAESSLSSSASSSASRISASGLGHRDLAHASADPQAMTPPRTEPVTLPSASASTSWSAPPQALAPAGAHHPKPTQNDGLALPNPLLDVGRTRVSNAGRGPLYPGSIFRGTQTSGRSAYEVEVKIVDVDLPASTLCGYLSISHLTDTHPHLTTFFTAELIGPRFGFITGARYGATEPDDMRHWGRFEPFRRPATRADFVRPELLLRDPVPDASNGDAEPVDRDFVFMRIKEKFLVPDHTVKDISGASFAGFYYAMLDLSPTVQIEDPAMPAAMSRSPPLRTPLAALAQSPDPHMPILPRRQSSARTVDVAGTTHAARDSVRPGLRARESSAGRTGGGVREATIRGYYFHSLNQEPFQELFLTHVPARSTSTFEMR